MPRIPQDDNPIAARPPLGSPQIPSFAFGITDPSAGAGLGQSMANMGAAIGGLIERAHEVRRERWVGEASTQLTQSYSDFFKDEKNLQAEDFDIQFEKFAKAQLQRYEQDAPDGFAKADFRLRAQNAYRDYSMAAFRQATKTRGINQFESVRGQINSANVEAHNMYQSVLPDDARIMVENSIAGISQSIGKVFGNMPQSHAELQGMLYNTMALAVSEYDPEYARKLALSPYVDEKDRQTIFRHLDELTEIRATGTAAALNSQLSGMIATGLRQNSQVPPVPQKAFQAVWPKTWENHYVQFERERQAANLTSMSVAAMQGKNPTGMGMVVNALEKSADTNPGNPVTEEALIKVKAYRAAIQDRYEKDWAGTAEAEHPVISRARKNWQTMGATADEKRIFRSHEFDLKKQFQGTPPPDAPDDQVFLYHDRPTRDVQLLNKDDAQRFAAKFKTTDAMEFMRALAEYEDYVGSPGDPTKTALRVSDAFNDVVKLGELHGAYELAFLNRNHPSIGFYLNSLGTLDANKKAFEQEKGKFNQLLSDIQQDPKFQSISAGLMFDGKRADRMDDYKHGIAALTLGFIQFEKLSEPNARTKAIDFLFNRQLHTADMGGYNLIIPKYRSQPGMPDRSPEELTFIESQVRQLFPAFEAVAENPKSNPVLWKIASMVARKDIMGRELFPILEALGGPEEDKISRLALQIGRNGLLRSTRDGQGATLHIKDDVGGAFELRDTNNKPFLIEWDNRETPPWWMGNAVTTQQDTVDLMLEMETGFFGTPHPAGGPVVITPAFNWPNQGIRVMEEYRKLRPGPGTPVPWEDKALPGNVFEGSYLQLRDAISREATKSYQAVKGWIDIIGGNYNLPPEVQGPSLPEPVDPNELLESTTRTGISPLRRSEATFLKKRGKPKASGRPGTISAGPPPDLELR